MVNIKKEESGFLRKKINISGTQIIALGFMIIILFGAGLLMIPFASRQPGSVSFIDALFTSTTSMCVTGLVVADTHNQWTVFGQIIIMMLIQTGGLGFMAVATLFSMAINRRIGFKERMILSEAISLNTISGVVRLTKKIILGTICFEVIGTILLSTRFIPEFGLLNGLYKSVFHSVSAFCNAGIDLMGEKGAFSSLTSYVSDPIVNITIGGLIIIGGLGFAVWEDLYQYRKKRKLRLHTKLVLAITTILIVGGTVLIYLFEYKNPNTLGRLDWTGRILASLFQSITPRTAGFNTVDLPSLTNPSVFLMMLLMLIGGSPGSTAGGIKTTTVGIVVLATIAVIRGSSRVQVFGKRISENQLLRALAIVIISFAIVCMGIIVLLVVDDLPFKEAVFEVISAFGTVGLSMGITPSLSSISKMTIIIIMYLGRVGVMTAAIAITKRQHSYEEKISYPVENILF